MADTRFCSKCGETKPLIAEFFYANRSRGKGDWQNYCKLCNNKKGQVPPRPTPENPSSYENIAFELGVSTIRVQQIERSALAKLRKLVVRAGLS